MTFSIENFVEAARLIRQQRNDTPKSILAVPDHVMIREGISPKCMYQMRMPDGIHLVVSSNVIDKIRKDSDIASVPSFDEIKSPVMANFYGLPIKDVDELLGDIVTTATS